MPPATKSQVEEGTDRRRHRRPFAAGICLPIRFPCAPMKRLSFSTQLATLWTMVAAICSALVAVVWFMATSAESRQITDAKQQATSACTAVASRYSLSRPLSGAAASTDLMHAVLDIVLVQAHGVEGGFWTLPIHRQPMGSHVCPTPT